METPNKKPLLILLIGILVGALLVGGGVLLGVHISTQTPEDASSPIGLGTVDSAPPSRPEPDFPASSAAEQGQPPSSLVLSENAESFAPLEASAQDTWDASATYTGGQEVTYQNRRWKARWWTQGDTPDFNNKEGVWEYIGETTPLIIPEEEDELVTDKPHIQTGDFKVVAYYPSWAPQGLSKIQFDTVTHVIYAFAIPTAEAGLRPLENPETAKKLIDAGHKAGVKVMIAIGGWSYNDVPLEPTFISATEDDAKLETFASAILSLVEEYGFDGVDMDWEHPRVDGNSAARYEKLMLRLSGALHEKGKLLTSAVISGATPDGTVYYDAPAHSDKVIAAVDWLNVMAYDGGDGDRHSSYQFAVDCGNYWSKTRKAGPGKVVLGMPFYGRPSWASYEDILAANPDAWKTDISTVNGMEAHYNGVDTIRKKTRFALDNLGGVMVWEITQDTAEKDKSLISAIRAEMEAGKQGQESSR